MSIQKKKIDDVYDYIDSFCSIESIFEAMKNGESLGVTAYDIEIEIGIKRNNASTLLNALHAGRQLTKIKGKPVEFLPTKLVSTIATSATYSGDITDFTRESFSRLLMGEKAKATDDTFQMLIGYENSLLEPINRAKAAMIYPPNGLHTLLLGSSGVGKTTFAKCMHLFALNAKDCSEIDLPFVHFNCSDYYTNPQLLLSQLFGHVKGAFSGAERAREGLVAKADGGILFLDEIHRLSSDGQEMLFSLMDNGTYSRLGDASTKYRCNVLLIAATTEHPQQALLKTFLRRIPVTITLPGVQEKPLEERLKIIQFLFKNEAIRTNRRILISRNVLRALMMYECKGNIGQLKSDIKLICAKAFLNCSDDDEQLSIEYQFLPRIIKDKQSTMSLYESSVIDKIPDIDDCIVSPDESIENRIVDFQDNQAHDKLRSVLSDIDDSEMSNIQYNQVVNAEITEYYQDIIGKYNYDRYNIREFYKIVDQSIVDFTHNVIVDSEKKLDVKFQGNLLFGLSIHIHSLITRVGDGEVIKNNQVINLQKQHPNYFKVSEEIVLEISAQFNIDIPFDEIGFMCVILMNNLVKKANDSKIGLLIISHGQSTATSMGAVCNRLLNTDHVHALDMPLELPSEQLYPTIKQLIESIDQGKGVIVLVDMGSINSLGKRISEETGIVTRTFEGVSTPLALEVLRRVLYRNETIEEFDVPQLVLTENSIKKGIDSDKLPVVLSVCVTGLGASQLIENKVQLFIKESCPHDVDVVSISLDEIKENGLLYRKIQEKYNILGCVGTINPEIDYPFIPVEALFSDLGSISLSNMLAQLDVQVDKESIFENSIEILSDYVLFINPKLAVRFIREFLIKIVDSGQSISTDSILKLTIHTCCMLERVILGNAAKFDNLEEYKSERSSQFVVFSDNMSILETPFDICISDDEIAYMLKVLENSTGEK